MRLLLQDEAPVAGGTGDIWRQALAIRITFHVKAGGEMQARDGISGLVMAKGRTDR